MDAEKLTEKLVSWLRERVTEASCRGTVFGISGGIDSAVVAALCKRAFPDSTLGIFIPCYSIPQDREHTLAVVEKFSIPLKEVIIDSIYDDLAGLLPDFDKESVAGLPTKANIKVRLRMLTLYYFANQLGYMVVGSSNRSELAIGYFTKFGDGGVDIVPLGILVKRQVRELAAFLGVPQVIIDKPPSAGLWPGQTDEAEIGLTYDEIDEYLLTGKANVSVREKIEFKIASNHHKRQPPSVPDFQVP
ncbi:MAG TPA: NAD(+) synthase [Dehalococcoidia bacterium]|nr:NAD(+) synthase [Dehalococcoidia bacterium]